MPKKPSENEEEFVARTEYMELIALDYKGIEVDKCAECEGIWLDAGELETVSRLEKSGIDKLFSVFKRE